MTEIPQAGVQRISAQIYLNDACLRRVLAAAALGRHEGAMHIYYRKFSVLSCCPRRLLMLSAYQQLCCRC
jgi:hypothetical protein